MMLQGHLCQRVNSLDLHPLHKYSIIHVDMTELSGQTVNVLLRPDSE